MEYGQLTEKLYNHAYMNRDDNYNLWYLLRGDIYVKSLCELVNKIRNSRISHLLHTTDTSLDKDLSFNRVFSYPNYPEIHNKNESSFKNNNNGQLDTSIKILSYICIGSHSSRIICVPQENFYYKLLQFYKELIAYDLGSKRYMFLNNFTNDIYELERSDKFNIKPKN